MLPIFPLLLLVSPVFSTDSCDPETKVLTNLWRVSADPPSYFFGTIHVPYTRVWDGISEQAKGAFQSADQVYLEREFGLNSDKTMKNCRLLPSNKKLTDVLSPKLVRSLRDHLGWLRTEIPSWERIRPQWLW